MKLGKIVIISALILVFAAYFVIPPYKNFIDMTLSAFASGNFRTMRDFVADYGGYAAVVSFFLMIFQSIAAPLPATAPSTAPTMPPQRLRPWRT